VNDGVIRAGYLPIAADVPPAIEAAARAWIAAKADDELAFIAYLKAPSGSPAKAGLYEAFEGTSARRWEAGDEVDAALHAPGVPARTWFPVDGHLVGLVRTRFGLQPRIKPAWCPYPRRSRGARP
jgi:hypothetical protein